MHTRHAGRQVRYRPAYQHINCCLLAMQPFGKSDELYFIAEPLFTNEQEPATRNGFPVPFAEDGPDLFLLPLRQIVEPSVPLPAFFELTQPKQNARKMELHVGVIRQKPRCFHAVRQTFGDFSANAECACRVVMQEWMVRIDGETLSRDTERVVEAIVCIQYEGQRF